MLSGPACRVRRYLVVLATLLGALATTVLPVAAATGDVDDPLDPELRAWLDDHGPLRIGWPAFPPISAVDDDGNVVGYGVDVWTLGALRLAVPVEHVVVGPMPEVVAAFRAGEVDVVGGSAVRPDLVEGTTRSPGYAWPPTGFVTRRDRVAELTDTLDGALVTTVPGSPLEARIAEAAPEARYVAFPSTPEGLAAVASGEVDAFYGPYAFIGAAILESDLDLVPLGEPARAEVPIAGVAPEGSPQARLLAAMRAEVADGELALIHVRWTGFDLGDPAADGGVPGWVPVAGGAALVAIALLAGFALLLRAQVRRATARLVALNAELEDRVEERTGELASSLDQLSRSNRALERFSAVVAHDLKGPLTAVAGLSDVARAMPSDDPRRDDLMSRVSRQARRLGAMIDDILSDALVPDPEVDEDAATEEAAAFMSWLEAITAPEREQAGVRLHAQATSGVIDADLGVLRRAAINLVGNAIKHAAGVDGARVEVTLEEGPGGWLLTVDDDGPGIAPADRAAVFEQGFQVVDDDRGHGMGLTVVRDLVGAAGGRVTVDESELGGARFTVSLPSVVVPVDAA